MARLCETCIWHPESPTAADVGGLGDLWSGVCKRNLIVVVRLYKTDPVTAEPKIVCFKGGCPEHEEPYSGPRPTRFQKVLDDDLL